MSADQAKRQSRDKHDQAQDNKLQANERNDGAAYQ